MKRKTSCVDGGGVTDETPRIVRECLRKWCSCEDSFRAGKSSRVVRIMNRSFLYVQGVGSDLFIYYHDHRLASYGIPPPIWMGREIRVPIIYLLSAEETGNESFDDI